MAWKETRTSVSLKLDPEEHRALKYACIDQGETLQDFIKKAVSERMEKLKDDRHSDI